MSDERHETVTDNVSANHQFRKVAKMIPHEEVAVSEMQQPLQPVIDCHGLNAAKMREALENVSFYLPYFLQYMRLHREDAEAGGYYERILEVVNAALSAPPRNCDRPECATTKEAQDTWRKEDGGKTAYYEWLLATYTEGGTTDGKKH